MQIYITILSKRFKITFFYDIMKLYFIPYYIVYITTTAFQYCTYEIELYNIYVIIYYYEKEIF